MARRARLSWPGLPHLVCWRSLDDVRALADAEDLALLSETLRAQAADAGVALLALCVLPAGVWAVSTPQTESSLGHWLQAVGRRYGAAFNRRHQRRGTLWDARFRSAPVEPQPGALEAVRWVERQPQQGVGAVGVEAMAWPHSSAQQHGGLRSDARLATPAAYWALGNTPFERERAWRLWLQEPPPADWQRAFDGLSSGGWPIGSPAFVAALTQSMPKSPASRAQPLSGDASPTTPDGEAADGVERARRRLEPRRPGRPPRRVQPG